jgi:hypothetical protein
VYKVSAKATTDDYHKNVGIEEFTKWHNKLQEILREMGGKYIIIMVTIIVLLNYCTRRITKTHIMSICYI